ncbi:ATP-binding protein [Cellulomonas gilvus]|uniref:ATP-binding region ATPase domain protein n=1 Tax=Cellulomonas gilvus (strain ATCC 13127 / NRRL B-14078) TaxID=593907 RepID=F8A5R7_CELGA|nr:ATP-binding protein [Cellulomonas gilvus]AEI13357.1 hypothetical protein Celgi_2864 [Cellulomonas gilvus ATCC 13127]
MTDIASPTVDIRPDSDIYGTYRRLSYRPWFAIAEFVDNATQNFAAHRAAIDEAAGQPTVLCVDLFYDRDAGTLDVVDNAMGMNLDEFSRALQLAKPPADTSGRSEFGMGLKTAACWLGPRWRVISKRLGETVEYSAVVDVAQLKADKPTSLAIRTVDGRDPAQHYTRVQVEGLLEYDRVFVGRTLGKIKREIASIYRRDLLDGRVVITFNGERLEWVEPELLTEQVGDETIEWRREIDITIGGKPVGGWIGLLARGKAADAGFHLFRRDRLIQGGPPNGWKPWEIFGSPNSFQAQRLVGELDFDAWRVSHTKDAIDWSGADEHELLEALKDVCSDYISKARESRRSDVRPALSRAAAESVVEQTREELEDNDELGAEITIVEAGIVPAADEAESELVSDLLDGLGGDLIPITFGNTNFPTMSLGLVDDSHPSEPLVHVGFPAGDKLALVLNLRHPFVAELVGNDEGALKVLVYMLYVDALVERVSRKDALLTPAQLRKIKDGFLRTLKPLD